MREIFVSVRQPTTRKPEFYHDKMILNKRQYANATEISTFYWDIKADYNTPVINLIKVKCNKNSSQNLHPFPAAAIDANCVCWKKNVQPQKY